ncbi:MAG: 2-oxoacid:acceptor oxidoreductase subunit alpha [Candidatus Dojkabacteria bacterium]|jgi:2-oxoglutarate ferredoxin oxidoreductase subunit alpha
MLNNRLSIKFAGASGQGINTTGQILTQALNNSGYHIFGYREYPSLIKGGVASYQIDCSDKKINSSSKYCDILSTISDSSLHEYIHTVRENGLIIHDGLEADLTTDEEIFLKKRNITLITLDCQKIAVEAGGVQIMANAVLLGFLWRILNKEKDIIVDEILKFFENKKIDKVAEKKCILAGYNYPTYRDSYSKNIQLPKPNFLNIKQLVMTGNDAISLGALSSGARAFYGYPMTPATSIFKFLGETADQTGVLIKQAENEITAAQMVLGSMYMGTRAFTATSGGGFDLMIETISCAGMSETPFVVVLAQRIGAGTGVPTWTGAGDLNSAVKGGHGDFPKCVISVSDLESCYTLIQEAFNIADQYQIPVILLTEKQISEGLFSVDQLPKPLKIERGFEKGKERYLLTENGISPRWLPSKSNKPYLATSDEHLEDGGSTDNAEAIMKMSKKRMRKLETLEKNLPEPKYYGKKDTKTVFVGFGSIKNTILDIIPSYPEYGYLHYDYIYPLKTKEIEKLISKKKRLILVENNQTGQLGNLITEKTGYVFEEKLLKYDGRAFFVEDILDFINN